MSMPVAKLHFSLVTILLILISVALSPVFGQEEKDYNNQIWVDINPKWVTSTGKITLDTEMGYRIIFPHDWDRYVVGAGIRYNPFNHKSDGSIALQSLQFRAGIRDFYTASIGDYNLNELRIYQGVRVQWPTLRRMVLRHYVRLEERFEKVQNEDTRDFTMRFRYLITAKFHFVKPALANLYFPISAEIFLSPQEGLYFNDVTRITPGIGYDFTDQFSIEFKTSYHFSRNSNTDSFENNDLVFRLRVYFTF